MKCANYYKIGISKNPKTRRRTIQTHNPFKVELVATLNDPNYESVEKELHHLFASQRSMGEWFELKERQLSILKVDYGFDFIQSISEMCSRQEVPAANLEATKLMRVKNIEINECAQYFEDNFNCIITVRSSFDKIVRTFGKKIVIEAIDISIRRNLDSTKAIGRLRKLCKRVELKYEDPAEYFRSYIAGMFYNRFDEDLSNCDGYCGVRSMNRLMLNTYNNATVQGINVDKLCRMFSKIRAHESHDFLDKAFDMCIDILDSKNKDVHYED